MFYKIRILLSAMLSCAVVFAISDAKAQGVVTLSEEAMFDDGLDSEQETPALAAPDTPAPKETPAQMVAPNAPSDAPKIMPKGPAAALAPTTPAPASDKFSLPPSNKGGVGLFDSNENLPVVSDNVFAQMSELEKRTALLNLELRREKLQNEIEAVKDARRQALALEKEKEEALRLKNLEFEKEQERKVLEEQQKLRELDIKFETLRQEKVLGAYKNQMLERTQRWIENNAQFYKQIGDLRQSKKDLVNELKTKLLSVQDEARKAQTLHRVQVDGYKRELSDLQAQIGVLRSRIDTLEKETEEAKRNPFAGAAAAEVIPAGGMSLSEGETGSNVSVANEPTETDLSQLYAVTEIRGQGGELIAKLVNKSGTPFYVKRGTALQSGHIINDITTTYVMAEKSGDRKHLYLAAGGVLPADAGQHERLDDDEEDSSKRRSSTRRRVTDDEEDSGKSKASTRTRKGKKGLTLNKL